MCSYMRVFTVFQIAIFMYKFHNNVLPAAFHSVLTKVTSVHNYNTRFAAKHAYYLPYARTNYGKFNLRFQGPSVWNTFDDNVKLSSSMSVFKKRLKDQYFERYSGRTQDLGCSFPNTDRPRPVNNIFIYF